MVAFFFMLRPSRRPPRRTVENVAYGVPFVGAWLPLAAINAHDLSTPIRRCVASSFWMA